MCVAKDDGSMGVDPVEQLPSDLRGSMSPCPCWVLVSKVSLYAVFSLFPERYNLGPLFVSPPNGQSVSQSV